MKAALYARVSTDEQAQKDNSIPAQLRLLKEYCQKNGIEIYKEYADEGVTGQKEERPEFQKMLSAAYNGLIDIILVHKFDRFARKIELSRNIKTNLKNASVNVISISEPIEDSPMGFFMEGLYELMAEYYVKNLAVEVKKGMNERALKGKHMGQMPYGYYCSGGSVFVNEEQAAIVRMIFDYYKKGWGHYKIVKWLNNNHIPTFKGLIGAWQTFQVTQILKNTKYIGKNYWDGNFYDADFPPLVDTETFEAVAKRSKIQAETHTRTGNNREKHHLLGLMYCGECGSAMRIKPNKNWNGSKSICYTCRDASLYRNDCKFTKIFNADLLESEVDNYLSGVLSGTITGMNIETERHNDNLGIIQKGIEKIETELERAKKAYISGVFELGEYKDLKDELEQKKATLMATISQNEVSILENDRRTALLKKMESAWAIYKKAKTPNEKREVLQTFVQRITIYRDKFEVLFYI